MTLLLSERSEVVGTKGTLCSACVRSVMLYRSRIWPVKKEDMFVLLCFIEVGLGPLKRKVDMFVLLCCIEVGLDPLKRKIDTIRLERTDARMAR